MTVLEKVAYLKGLAEGLGLDSEKKEGKIIVAIIDTISEIAHKLEELDAGVLDFGEELDAISDDLGDVEKLLFDDEADDEDEDSACCDACCGSGEDDGDDYTYEVTCPSCGEDIEVDETDLASGEITCPSCGENLEFDFEDSDSDESQE